MPIPQITPPAPGASVNNGMSSPVYSGGTGPTSTSSGQLNAQMGNAPVTASGKQPQQKSSITPFKADTKPFAPPPNTSTVRPRPQPVMAPPVMAPPQTANEQVYRDMSPQYAALRDAGFDHERALLRLQQDRDWAGGAGDGGSGAGDGGGY